MKWKCNNNDNNINNDNSNDNDINDDSNNELIMM